MFTESSSTNQINHITNASFRTGPPMTHQRSQSLPQLHESLHGTAAHNSASSRLSELVSIMEATSSKEHQLPATTRDSSTPMLLSMDEEDGFLDCISARDGQRRLSSISHLLNPALDPNCVSEKSERGYEKSICLVSTPPPSDGKEAVTQFAFKPMTPPSLLKPMTPPSLPRSRLLANVGSVALSLPQITTNPSGHARSRSFDSGLRRDRHGSNSGDSLVYRHSKSFDHSAIPLSKSQEYGRGGGYTHHHHHPYASHKRSNSSSSTPTSSASSTSFHHHTSATLLDTQPSSNSTMHKSLRYDMLKNGTPIQRTCGDCSSNHTSGHWCQDSLVVGGYICQKCYRRRKRAQGPGGKVYIPPSRSCYSCTRETTDSVWFRHFSIVGAYVCSECHEKESSLDSNKPHIIGGNSAGTVATAPASQGTGVRRCHGCGSCKSTQWTVDSNGYVCRKCARQLGLVSFYPSSSNRTAATLTPALSVSRDGSAHQTHDGDSSNAEE